MSSSTVTYDYVDATSSAYGNGSSTDDHPQTRDAQLARAEVALQATIFVIAITGNVCVLIALRYRKRRTSRMHFFIMHLSIADLLVAMFNILPQMLWDATYPFRGGDALCRIVTYLQVMVIYLSSYVLLLTAFDRYRAICRPLSNYAWTQRRLHLLTGSVWAIAAIFSLPQLFLFRMRRLPLGMRDCLADFQPPWTLQLYVTFFAALVYFLPLAILAGLYGRICYKVWRNVHAGGTVVYKFNGSGHISIISDRSIDGRKPVGGTTESSSSPPPTAQRHESRTFSRSKIKTIKMTFVVIVAYLICWMPYMTLQLWWAYDPNAPFNHHAFVLCLLLASLNSCCNPLIYMAFSGSLVQHALPCCPRHAKRRHRYARRPPPPPQLQQPPANRRPHTASVTIAEKAGESADAPIITRVRHNDLFYERRTSRRGLLTSAHKTAGKKCPQTPNA